MPGLLPYTCTGQEDVFDIEIFDANGNFFNCIIASECFAQWYCSCIVPGYTWRHRPPEPPVDPVEE